MKSFKISSIFVHAAHPSHRPFLEDALPVGVGWNSSYLCSDSSLQSIQIWKDNAFEILLQAGVKKQVIWG